MTEDRLAKRRAANRASYQRHKEQRQEKARAWRAKNPERMKQLNAAWYYKNHAKALAIRAQYRAEHREELRRLIREWYYRNKQRVSEAARLKATGCSPQHYAQLLEIQRGLCAVCSTTSAKPLVADHDHQTKRVRGLLCNRCNMLLGLVRDSSALLLSASLYVTQQETTVGAVH